MVIDHQQVWLLADHGPAWTDFFGRAARREPTARRRQPHDGKGSRIMIERKLHHLRHFALVMAATVVSTAFVGVAVLPALLGLDVAGRAIA